MRCFVLVKVSAANLPTNLPTALLCGVPPPLPSPDYNVGTVKTEANTQQKDGTEQLWIRRNGAGEVKGGGGGGRQ